jgi:hypothetical protein
MGRSHLQWHNLPDKLHKQLVIDLKVNIIILLTVYMQQTLQKTFKCSTEETLHVSALISHHQVCQFTICNAKHVKMSQGHPAYLHLNVLQIIKRQTC